MASVVEQSPFSRHVGNGVATVFGYEFHLLASSDLVVTIDDVAVPSSGYTITGIGDQRGGSVTFTTPPADQADVLLQRDVPLNRDTDYQYAGDFNAETVDRDFNRIWHAMQQQRALVDSCLKFDYPNAADPMGAPLDVADRLLAFDPSSGAPAPSTFTHTQIASLIAAFYGPANATSADLVIHQPAGPGAVARSTQVVLREVAVTPKSYGAAADGLTNDTSAFEDALDQSGTVTISDGTYLLDGLDIGAFGRRIVGSGTIKTADGTLVDLGTVDLGFKPGLRVMFMEGNKPSWEELLVIKSLGYTAVMAYPWYLDQEELIRNAEAVGLYVIVHSHIGTVVPGVITPKTDWDSRESVIGYYLLDEPAMNGISLSDQNAVIAAYRAATSKPLFTAENTVMYGTKLIASGYDVIFADVYYANSYSTGKEPMAQYLRNLAEFGVHCSTAKIIPCVGLFNDAGFGKSESLTTQLAATLLRFSPDGSFAVFCWDAGTTPGAYDGVRNIAAYRSAARRLAALSMAYKPYRVEVVALGDTVFGGNNKLHLVWKNCADGASPGLFAANGVTPWETKNVGSAIDSRQQNFADAGLLISSTGGRAGFAGMPSGLCAALLYYRNRSNAATCTVNLGYSLTGGYDYTSAVNSGAIAVDGSWAGTAVLSADAKNLPVLNAALSISTSAPFAWLSGYLVFSDAPAVSF